MGRTPPRVDSASLCANLARNAVSGVAATEILLAGYVSELQASEIRLLSGKLKHLSKDAEQLGARLHVRGTAVMSPELRTKMTYHLPECDDALSLVLKQLQRATAATGGSTIDTAIVAQFGSFSDVVSRFLVFCTQLIIFSIADQESKLEVEDSKLLCIRVAHVCQEVRESRGILIDTSPPAYDDPPPPFEASSSSDTLKLGAEKAGNHDSDSLSIARSPDKDHKAGGGFFSSLVTPLKAATAGLWTKPEPLVVPLCHAASLNNIAQLKSLLSQGVNINGYNEEGKTALICAVLAGHLEAIRALLEAGADHKVCNTGRKGKPPLFHAVDVENKAAVEVLLQHGAAAKQTDEWGQAYFLNLVTGDTAPQWIELLLLRDADAARAKDTLGTPAVVLALAKRKGSAGEDVARLLLRHGARPDSRDSNGTPLVHLCLQQGRVAFLHELLALGASPDARDVSGTPLLAAAVQRGDGELVRALLARSADPNAVDVYGYPPVLTVLRDGKLAPAERADLAETLLRHGARGDVKDSWGVTALEHALASMWADASATAGSSGRAIGIPELLLKQGANANQKLSKVTGEPTLLTHAIDRAEWDVVDMALRHGADANLADKKGRTPLVLAMQRGNEEVVASLLQRGADVNKLGLITPLDLATMRMSEEVIRLVKARGPRSAG